MTARYFETERHGPLLFVSLSQPVSSLTNSGILQELNALLAEVRQSRPAGMVVDLRAATYFGSCLLEVLRHLGEELKQHGGRMTLCEVSPIGREVLHIAHFDKLWPIAGSRDEARGLVAPVLSN